MKSLLKGEFGCALAVAVHLCCMNVALHARSRNMHGQGPPAPQCVPILLDEDIEILAGWLKTKWTSESQLVFTPSLLCSFSLPSEVTLLVFMAYLGIWPKPEFLRSLSPCSYTTWAWVAISHCWSRNPGQVPKWTTWVPYFSACPHYIMRTMPPPVNWVSSLFTAGL